MPNTGSLETRSIRAQRTPKSKRIRSAWWLMPESELWFPALAPVNEVTFIQIRLFKSQDSDYLKPANWPLHLT